jgi:hypothetical protein
MHDGNQRVEFVEPRMQTCNGRQEHCLALLPITTVARVACKRCGKIFNFTADHRLSSSVFESGCIPPTSLLSTFERYAEADDATT